MSSRKNWIFVLLIIFIIGGITYGVMSYLKKPGSSVPAQKITVGKQGLDKENVEIILLDSGFQPNQIEVTPGTSVRWSNLTNKPATINSSPHPEHSDYEPLNLGDFVKGEKSPSLVFEQEGTYKYHNHFKPEQVGTIIVAKRK